MILSKKVLKKAREPGLFKETLEEAYTGEVPEVDEIFTYILMKIKGICIWIALCRQIRFFIGDGSIASCKRLWRKLSCEYLGCGSFSHFRCSYNYWPAKTHTKVGKEAGKTTTSSGSPTPFGKNSAG